jgi:hypothetical protein
MMQAPHVQPGAMQPAAAAAAGSSGLAATQAAAALLGLPPQLLDRVAGKARLRQLLHLLDGGSAGGEAAVAGIAGGPVLPGTAGSSASGAGEAAGPAAHRSASQASGVAGGGVTGAGVEIEDEALNLLQDMLGRFVDDATSFGAELARTRTQAGVPGPHTGVVADGGTAVLDAADLQCYVREVWPLLVLPTASLAAPLRPAAPVKPHAIADALGVGAPGARAGAGVPHRALPGLTSAGGHARPTAPAAAAAGGDGGADAAAAGRPVKGSTRGRPKKVPVPTIGAAFPFPPPPGMAGGEGAGGDEEQGAGRNVSMPSGAAAPVMARAGSSGSLASVTGQGGSSSSQGAATHASGGGSGGPPLRLTFKLSRPGMPSAQPGGAQAGGAAAGSSIHAAGSVSRTVGPHDGLGSGNGGGNDGAGGGGGSGVPGGASRKRMRGEE